MKFDFSKSRPAQDLSNTKSDVQHKVLCDWLRNIHQQNIQIARKLTILQRTVESMFPSGEPMEETNLDDYSSQDGSVS